MSLNQIFLLGIGSGFCVYTIFSLLGYGIRGALSLLKT